MASTIYMGKEEKRCLRPLSTHLATQIQTYQSSPSLPLLLYQAVESTLSIICQIPPCLSIVIVLVRVLFISHLDKSNNTVYSCLLHSWPLQFVLREKKSDLVKIYTRSCHSLAQSISGTPLSQ